MIFYKDQETQLKIGFFRQFFVDSFLKQGGANIVPPLVEVNQAIVSLVSLDGTTVIKNIGINVLLSYKSLCLELENLLLWKRREGARFGLHI